VLWKKLILVVLAPALFSLMLSCGAGDTGDRTSAVATILPLAEFTRIVGGDKVEVTTLVPPGSSPHTYEPTPNQLVNVSRADLYVTAGSGIEFEMIWMDKIRSVNKEMLIVNSSEGVDLLHLDSHESSSEENETTADKEEHHVHGKEGSGTDPHVWLSPVNVKTMVANICDALVRIDPVNQSYFERNRDHYQAQLNEVDSYIRETLSGAPGNRFLIYHPAWGYFAHEYGLEQIAIEHEGKEPTARELVNIVKRAEELGIKAVVVEPRSSNISAEVVAGEIGGGVIVADPLAGDYLQNMRKVADGLAEILK
jgi:zinc transport system substrate-binding protein